MAFCFNTREEARQRLAERGGANYRHHFIEATAESQFVVYHTIDSVLGHPFKTVLTLEDAFELVEQVDWKSVSPGKVDTMDAIRKQNEPLVWEHTARGGLMADSGRGIYCVYRSTRWRWPVGPRTVAYTAVHHFNGSFGRESIPDSNDCPYRFETEAAARASCERYHASCRTGDGKGKWDH